MTNPLTGIYMLSVMCLINFKYWKLILCKLYFIRVMNRQVLKLIQEYICSAVTKTNNFVRQIKVELTILSFVCV